jgi:signal peptidase I
MKWIKRLLIVAVVLTPAAAFLFGWLSFRVYLLPTSSMEPTLLIGDRILTRIVNDAIPKRGEMLAFRSGTVLLIKRVVAIPGDHVRIQDKKLFVNSQEQREDYVVHVDSKTIRIRDEFPADPPPGLLRNPEWMALVKSRAAAGDVVVPPFSSFALGDNRDVSLDSRYQGFYRNDQIAGKLMMILYSVEKRDDPNTSGDFRWGRLFTFL